MKAGFVISAALLAAVLSGCHDATGGHDGLPRSAKTAQTGKGLTFEQETIDLGTVEAEGGKPVTVEFRFTNTSGKVAVIHDIKTDCGCTTAQWDRKPVNPGDSGVIRITYDGRGKTPGLFQKTAGIYTNVSDGAQKVRLRGEMK